MRREPSVLHLDADAFFAAVEQIQRPSLRGRPVIVGGTGGRGVVATASYEARVFGVHSAMPMTRARALCPDGVILTPRFAAYHAHSDVIMGALRELSPLVEPVSLDEAFVDLAAGGIADPVAAADWVRRVIFNRSGLVVSVGLGRSKLVAKLASDADKPHGFTVVTADAEDAFLLPLPVRRLWGVGPATAAALERLGITTVEQLRGASERDLVAQLGHAHGTSLFRLARGDDTRPVVPERETKSVSAERTFAEDLFGEAAQVPALERVFARAHARLSAQGFAARTVTVKVRLADFTTLTRAVSVPHPTVDVGPLLAAARAALTLAGCAGDRVRLLGVAFSGLSLHAQLTFDLPGGGAAELPADGGDSDDVLPAVLTAAHAVPGVDVLSAEYGPGWISGVDGTLVRVRFETPTSAPGRDRLFDVRTGALMRCEPPPVCPPRKLARVDGEPARVAGWVPPPA